MFEKVSDVSRHDPSPARSQRTWHSPNFTWLPLQSSCFGIPLLISLPSKTFWMTSVLARQNWDFFYISERGIVECAFGDKQSFGVFCFVLLSAGQNSRKFGLITRWQVCSVTHFARCNIASRKELMVYRGRQKDLLVQLKTALACVPFAQ